jgi:hypothetical protein
LLRLKVFGTKYPMRLAGDSCRQAKLPGLGRVLLRVQAENDVVAGKSNTKPASQRLGVSPRRQRARYNQHLVRCDATALSLSLRLPQDCRVEYSVEKKVVLAFARMA